jgi:sugar phosphate permease
VPPAPARAVGDALHRYRWVVLAVGMGSQMAVASVRGGLPALGPALRGEYGLTLPQVGLALSSFALGVMATLIAWGALADRAGERRVVAGGLTGAAGALAVAAFASSLLALAGALVVAGALSASAIAASGKAVTAWFRQRERGLAHGVRQMGVPVGGGVAALSLPWIAGAGGLRAAFLALAGATLIFALIAARWLRDPPPGAGGPQPALAPLPSRDRRLWRLAGASGLLILAQVGITSFVVLFLHDERGWSPAAAAAALATIQFGGAGVRVAVGRWSDRAGGRIGPMRAIAAAAAVTLGAAAALTGAPSAFLVPALLAAGILSMSWNGLSVAAAAEMAGASRAGTAIGIQSTVVSAMGALAPLLFSGVVAVTSWGVAYGLLTLAQAAAVLLLLPLTRG